MASRLGGWHPDWGDGIQATSMIGTSIVSLQSTPVYRMWNMHIAPTSLLTRVAQSSDMAGALVWYQERILVPNRNDTPTWTHLQETGLKVPTYLHSTYTRIYQSSVACGAKSLIAWCPRQNSGATCGIS